MKNASVPSKILDRYLEIIDRHPVLIKKGKTNPYTSHNSRMTSFLTKEFGLALRLSKTQIAELVDKHNALPVIEYGAVMKDFIQLPEDVFYNNHKVDFYVNLSFEHTDNLPVKKKK